MRKFNETTTVQSIFGTVRLDYVPAYTNDFGHEYASCWKATILDGDFNGWNETGIVESVALKNLIVSVATRHASNLNDMLDGVDTTFTGGPED